MTEARQNGKVLWKEKKEGKLRPGLDWPSVRVSLVENRFPPLLANVFCLGFAGGWEGEHGPRSEGRAMCRETVASKHSSEPKD